MANISLYNVPFDETGKEIRRGRCLFCTTGDCAGFFANGDSVSGCLCSHHWHSHHPLGPELSRFDSRFQRGGCSSYNCAGFFPLAFTPDPSSICLCSARIHQHEPIPSLVGPPIPSTIGTQCSASQMPQAGPSSGPSWRTMVLPSSPAVMNAAQRRTADASQTFHHRTSLTARAHAPHVLSGLAPATTISSGPRLGVPNAPTTQAVLFHPSTGLQAPAPLVGLDFVFAIIPVTLEGLNKRGVPFPIPQRLVTKWEAFADHLHENLLVHSYRPSRADLAGAALLMDIHRRLVDRLSTAGYTVHAPSVLDESTLQEDNFPWQFVSWSNRGATHRRLGILKIDPPEFTIKLLTLSPFGKGPTRPRIVGQQGTVILIMPRHHDLLAPIPRYGDERRGVQHWNEEVEPSTILHRCVGRRVMSGFYTEDIPSTPSDYSCWDRCGVRVVGGEILPISSGQGARSKYSSTPAPPSSASAASSSPPLTPQVRTGSSTLPTFREPIQAAPRPLEIVLDPVPTVFSSDTVAPVTSLGNPRTMTPGDIFRSVTTFSIAGTLHRTSDNLLVGEPLANPVVVAPSAASEIGSSRIRPRSESPGHTNRPTHRRRIEGEEIMEILDSSDSDGGSITYISTDIKLFSYADRPCTPAVYTPVEDGNLVDGFISAVFLATQAPEEVRLTARTERIAATALLNAILTIAALRFNCRVQLAPIDAALYSWYPRTPVEVGSLFKREFCIFIGNDNTPLVTPALGNGPLIATMRILVELALANGAFFDKQSNEAGYRGINFDDSDINDVSRTASFWTAGCVAALHILQTSTGPHPISPFLLYLSLETNLNRLVNFDFISSFDDTTAKTFFKLLSEVQTRRYARERPYLAPFKDWYLYQRGRELSHTETAEVGDNTVKLRLLIIGILGEILGVRGFVNQERFHPDFSAFRNGFRSGFLPDATAKIWPVPRDLREFFSLLYNRQPETPDDIDARVVFKSSGDPKMTELERIWEAAIREYIRGVGIPRLSRWLDIAIERINFSHVAGRATQLLKAMSGSDLMPAKDDWSLTFTFAVGVSSAFEKQKDSRPTKIYEGLQALTFFEFHTCHKSAASPQYWPHKRNTMNEPHRIITRSRTGNQPVTATTPTVQAGMPLSLSSTQRRSARLIGTQITAGQSNVSDTPHPPPVALPVGTESDAQPPQGIDGSEHQNTQFRDLVENEVNHPELMGNPSEETAPRTMQAPAEDQEQSRNFPISLAPNSVVNADLGHSERGGVDGASQDMEILAGSGPLFTVVQPEVDTVLQQGGEWTIELGTSKGQMERDRGRQAFWEVINRMEERLEEDLPMPKAIKIIFKAEDGEMSMEWENSLQSLDHGPIVPQPQNGGLAVAQAPVSPAVAVQPATTPVGLHSLVPANQIHIPAGPTVEPGTDAVQRDLDQNGSHEAAEILNMLTTHRDKCNGFFYCRRMVEILDSLGGRFGLSPKSHTQKVVYDVLTGRSLGTTDLIEWARRHGWSISPNTVNNYRTLWTRAQKGIPVLERRRAEVSMEEALLPDGPEKVQKVLLLRELDQTLELFNVLVECVDVDAPEATLQFVTAAEVWRMKQWEWLNLVQKWAPVVPRRR